MTIKGAVCTGGIKIQKFTNLRQQIMHFHDQITTLDLIHYVFIQKTRPYRTGSR